MIVALANGDRVVADRSLTRSRGYTCPVCGDQVVLKAGAIVTAHFAHRTGSNCNAAGESRRHLAAKKLLADELTTRGWTVELERMHGDDRRADLLVTTAAGDARFTIEIQDSRIQVDTMKDRERADRAAGCLPTCWIFTDNRITAAWDDVVFGQCEVRLPDDMRYRWNATYKPLPLLRDRQLVLLTPEAVYRDGNEWHDSSGDLQNSDSRLLRSTFTLTPAAATFDPTLDRDRYGRAHIGFKLADDWWNVA